MTVRITEHGQRRSRVERWQRHGTDGPPSEGHVPTPTQPYGVAALEIGQHAPAASDDRHACGAEWPCDSVRLTCRLDEGF